MIQFAYSDHKPTILQDDAKLSYTSTLASKHQTYIAIWTLFTNNKLSVNPWIHLPCQQTLIISHKQTFCNTALLCIIGAKQLSPLPCFQYCSKCRMLCSIIQVTAIEFILGGSISWCGVWYCIFNLGRLFHLSIVIYLNSLFAPMIGNCKKGFMIFIIDKTMRL